MDLPILYAWHKDIVFHVLTHMKVDNASNIFNENYIEEISLEKKKLGIQDNLRECLEALTDYYMTHFERLTIINFIPFVTNSFEALTQTLMHLEHFTEEDQSNFIHPFIAILEEEKPFYYAYWHQKDALIKHRKAIIEKHLNNSLMPFKCLFDYYEQHMHMKVDILLSYSMGQNGRGSSNGQSHLVALPFPFNETHEENTFFMALHELTHPCTDDLVSKGKAISMKDGSHALTENIVMVADYELIKVVNPLLLESYLKWIFDKLGDANAPVIGKLFYKIGKWTYHRLGYPNARLIEKLFYKIFIIPDEINCLLQERIREIIDTKLPMA